MTEKADRNDHRPSPDALLAAAKGGKDRGRLKIFLGAAPGVGKTFAMLESAHRSKHDGVDVVVGIVETHGRRETEALTEGLEPLPRLQVPYRDRLLSEFDLDAALRRKPKLILIDELAHSNAPGLRHPKRYQDVIELLAAGIDVFTTLNVQHLESLNDIVARITRVRVRETLPDEVLERADEIELVDLTPQELIKRLHEGKVYVAGQAQRAVAHFFQPGNITALRELALRRVAERVDEQMVDYMRQHAIVGPWPAGERLLACIGPDADALAVVRAARRLADQLHAPWTAAYVEMPGHYRLGIETKSHLAEALRLAEQLGGEAVTLPARDLVEELIGYAKSRNVTKILIGRRPAPSWVRLMRRSLVEALVRQSGDIVVQVVPLGRTPPRRLPRWGALPRQPAGYLMPMFYVSVAVSIGVLFEQLTVLPSPQPFFFVAVLLAASRHGLVSSIIASLLSFTAYNFFFIDPRYTLTVAQPHEVAGLFLFLFAAVLVSGLAARMRDQAEDVRRRMKAQGTLYEFSRKLATAVGLDDLVWATSYQIAATVGGQAIVLLADGQELQIAGAFPPGEDLEPSEWAAARWAWQHGEPAGRASATLPTLAWHFEPMKTSRGTVGVIGYRFAAEAALDSERRRTLAALIDQSAVAVERSRLDREMADARVIASTEKLRHALLSSISHDLRTPLAAIIGAVSSVKNYGDRFDQATRADLLATIEDEAQRLNRFVGNLLDMTRLEAGMLAPRRDWVAIDDLLASAAKRARRQLATRPLTISVSPGLPLLRLDFVLMEQVLFNLLDNAAKYSAPTDAVSLGARAEDGAVVIDVTDQGRGIPEGDLQRVFDKFYRIAAEDRQVPGTGLGLAVCKGIVEAHGGEIRAAGHGPDGSGTVMEIRLPIETAPNLEGSA